jgi:hypothetical protein
VASAINSTFEAEMGGKLQAPLSYEAAV